MRAETGSPLLSRIASGVFGIVINLTYLVLGPTEWPTFAVVAVLITAAPAWVLVMRATLRLTIKKGLFFGYKHPILNFRWLWWVMIWPARTSLNGADIRDRRPRLRRHLRRARRGRGMRMLVGEAQEAAL